MVTSRFHKDEAAFQRDTMVKKVKSRRTIALVVEVLVMLALFIVMVVFLGPLTTDPLYLPIYPAIIVPLAFGAAFLVTGAFFKKKLYDLADFSEKPPLRKRFGTVGLVYAGLFVALALVLLIAIPPFEDTNLAEQTMVREADTTVGANTYIRLQFEGADKLGSFRAEVSVTCKNNVSLDFALMEYSDAESYDPAIPATNAISSRENATSYIYQGTELKAQNYTLIINNIQNDTANIHYKVFERTSDGLSLVLIVFFLVYVGIAGGWVAYIRGRAKTETVPVIAPPVPGPMPQRPVMPGPPQPGMGMPAQATAPTAPGPAPESGGVPMSITCPRCATVFEVMRGAGPTKIKCPGCGKEGTLAGLPAAAIAAARAQQAPAQPAPMQQPAMVQGAMPQQYAPQQYAPQQYPPQQYAPQYQEAPARPEYPPARMAQAGTGTSYPPSAPQAYAQTGPAVGDMYAQPPPPAPAVPPSPYDQLMAMGLGPAEPAIPEAPTTPVPAAAPAPAPVAKKTIACPRCKQAFQIDKVEGPQHIRCPHCGKEGTIGARKPAALAAQPAPAPAQPVRAPAPAPMAPAQAPAPRPAPAAPAIQTPSPIAGAAPAGAGPKMISCPACKRPFPVTETRRPIQVKCPSCGKEGVLKR